MLDNHSNVVITGRSDGRVAKNVATNSIITEKVSRKLEEFAMLTVIVVHT